MNFSRFHELFPFHAQAINKGKQCTCDVLDLLAGGFRACSSLGSDTLVQKRRQADIVGKTGNTGKIGVYLGGRSPSRVTTGRG